MQDLKEDNHKMEKDETFEKSSRFDIQDAALHKGKFIICYVCPFSLKDVDVGKYKREIED